MRYARAALGTTIAILATSGVAQSQIVINELLYDGVGTDSGMFTELKGDPGTSLDGYALEGVNGNGGGVYRTIDLTGQSIPADGYFVLAQDATVSEGDMIDSGADWQNGPDQVRLVLGTDIIDSICYGSTVDLDCEGSAAPDVASGIALARCPDGSDTDDNETDFFEDDTPTPGAANDVVCGVAPVVNEVLYDGTGADTGMFTEIKGAPGMSLNGYTLVGVNGNGGVDYATVDLSGHVIPSDGYFVVAQDATVAEADLIDPLVDFQNGPDAVELRLDGVKVDGVCYGTSPDLVCEGGTSAPDASAGFSIARCPDGQDTDDNEADFAIDATPTPGAENDADCGGSDPTDYTLCDLAENDASGFPIHFGERVRVTDLVALVGSGVFAVDRLDIAVGQPSSGCCVTLFDFGYDIGLNPIAEGDVITEVVGTVDFFNGKTEITSIEVLTISGTAVVDPTSVTTGELATGGEAYDNCLIEICGVTIVEGTWPAEGESVNLTIDDGSGPVILRIDGDTDVDGTASPDEPFTVVGIATQFDSSAPYDSGYQIIPRRRSDVEDGVTCPTPTLRMSWGEMKDRHLTK
jgi:hypothetical protein